MYFISSFLPDNGSYDHKTFQLMNHSTLLIIDFSNQSINARWAVEALSDSKIPPQCSLFCSGGHFASRQL